MNDTYDVLGVNIAATNLNLACKQIFEWIQSKTKTYVCVAPVSTVMDCQGNEEYRNIVNSSGMNTPDGMPVVWLGKVKGYEQLSRTYGPDLMLAFCRDSQDKGIRHYFYGATEGTIRRLVDKIKEMFPGIVIAGSFAPPVRVISELEEESVIEKINQLNPDIIWVGLGSPKQDYWMFNHRERLNAPVLVGVGAAFDFIAGTKPQAPLWMRRIGLEWLFRLCCEPRRLWKRYLVGNSRFVYLILKEKLKGKKNG